VPDPEPCPDPCPVVLIKVKVHPCLDLNFAGSRQKKRPQEKLFSQRWQYEFEGSVKMIGIVSVKMEEETT
jgi:hypothetical protein